MNKICLNQDHPLFLVQVNFVLPVMVCIIWPQGYKTFTMLSSVEHEILNYHKCKNIEKFSFFRLRSAENAIFPAHKCLILTIVELA